MAQSAADGASLDHRPVEPSTTSEQPPAQLFKLSDEEMSFFKRCQSLFGFLIKTFLPQFQKKSLKPFLPYLIFLVVSMHCKDVEQKNSLAGDKNS